VSQLRFSSGLKKRTRTPPLLPNNPLKRARVREAVELANGWIHPGQCSLLVKHFHPDASPADVASARRTWCEHTLPALHDRLYQESAFAVGDSFSWADMTVLGMVAKAVSLGTNARAFPRFVAHARHCMSLDDAARSCPDDLRDMLSRVTV
jgi:glutathione S-transferase